MGKNLYIAEKPSVAKEFAKALNLKTTQRDGYMESENAVITWCVGHLVTMSYPEAYDDKYKKWTLGTLPFIPVEYQYQIIDGVKKQFHVVKGLLNREDVTTIYVCTDSGREGEYIYRLVEKMAMPKGKDRKRVWIDSQTEEEILRGIREAKDLSYYDNLSKSAFLRAKEDYLMGINFSRVLTLKYAFSIKEFLKAERTVISVGRVMTCVLGMVVNREREIRNFIKTPFYKIQGLFKLQDISIPGEWKVHEGSRYFQHPDLYKENGFQTRERAEECIQYLSDEKQAILSHIEKKKEQKNAPLLYNLAELQNECSRLLKISPDECLKVVQELYEKKLTTYPRTDARVLSTAVCKEITKNINGLKSYPLCGLYAVEILEKTMYKNLEKTKYVNDKQITDHYAIIPTGSGLNELSRLNPMAQKVYEMIVRRFLSIFYPAAVYQKVALTMDLKTEKFYSNFKVLIDEGYLKIAKLSFIKQKADKTDSGNDTEEADKKDTDSNEIETVDQSYIELIGNLKKNSVFFCEECTIKEGETKPPSRYNSGSIILAMENAGQLIEDEDLRSQIKGSGIGTSATRAEILKKLITINYLQLNKKTQIISPALLGELIYEVVNHSVNQLLNPTLTASWEKGLQQVAEGSITEEQYMEKLDGFVSRRTNYVKGLKNQSAFLPRFNEISQYYKK